MSVSAKFGQIGKAITDRLVGFTSGSMPAPSIDTPRAYRLIFVIGLVGIGLCGWLIYRTITSVSIPPSKLATTSGSAIDELAKLKDKDTDGDSLSDYAELFSYESSPYLSDSDSDGLTDAQEIQRNQDPNCPAGKSCTGLAQPATPTDNGQISPAFLRQALQSAGVPKTVLDETDDAALLSIYQEVVGSQTTNTGQVPTLESLQQLQPAAIRQLLQDNGVDKATLDKMDDATLKQIFNQAVADKTTS